MTPLVAQWVKELEPPLSATRLQRYRPTLPGENDDLVTFVNYFWNMALAESLYCCLSAVEVALRNTLHDTLTQHFGTPNWYDRRGLLDAEQVREVVRAKNSIQRAGQPTTPGRVVAGLTFGFWVTILSRNYDSRLWSGHRAASLKEAFPRVPKRQRQRVQIHRRYNRIRELRNKVFHHEPIFDDPRLSGMHQDIHMAIHWINPELCKTIELFDSYAQVWRTGRAEIEAKLMAHVQLPTNNA